MTIRVLLVTGSRDWEEHYTVAGFMHGLAMGGWTGKDTLLINGYADGADQQTRTQAILLGWSVIDFHPSQFRTAHMSYGRACNVRNQAMVDLLRTYRTGGAETLSVAFWRAHSRGTENTLTMLGRERFEPSIFYDCECHS